MNRVVPMMTGALTVALLAFVTVGLVSAEAWWWAVVTGLFAVFRLAVLLVQAWRAWAETRPPAPHRPSPPSAPMPDPESRK